MALTTQFQGEIIIADAPENIVFGTCMIGNTYGSCESASVKRTADLEELEKCGGQILAAVMRKPKFELTLKCIFTADVDPPELGELVVFPLAGISGRVVPSIDIEWEKTGQRMISINATSWDAFAANNDGAGKAHSYDGTDYIDIDTGLAPV